MNQNLSNSFVFDQFQPPQLPAIHQSPQATDTELLQARENLMETMQAFLKEYDHIPHEEKCMALLLDEERFLKINQVMKEEQNQPEVKQELLLKQILKGIQPKQEEPAVQSFTPYENFSMIDDVEVLMKDIYTFLRKFSRIPFGVTPKVLSIAWERFSEIKHALTDKQYRQEDIQELMSKLLEDVRTILRKLIRNILIVQVESYCDVPSCDHFDAESGLINSLLSRDSSIISPKIDFLPEEFVGELDFINPILPGIDEDDFDEEDFDEEEENNNDILQIEDEILQEVDTFLVPEDSIPPGIESDLDSEGGIVFFDDLLYEDPIPEYERFTFDIEPDAPVINNFDEDECFDPGGGEIDVFQNVEDDDSFTFVIRIFLPYLTYPVDSPLLLSTGSEDTIFDPDIST
ncbi:hypothetical protein Tco_0628618 [Tanacetum coccineum]|uniref:Uncharacterized protein n=1 Tax=Tanacetum coccineum TaxID=301880 RepID=A0ABQ4WQU2_9ASTR